MEYSHTEEISATVLCKYCPVARTFKAAVPADEEEADFILVSVGQGCRGTNRGHGGPGVTVNHRCEGKHYGGNVVFRLSPHREVKLSLSKVEIPGAAAEVLVP